MTPENNVIKAELPTVIDSTQITCFRSCPRKFYNEFVLGLRPPGLSIDLHAGACFASALETVYKEVYLNGRSLTEALIRGLAKFSLDWGQFEIPEYKRTAKTFDRVWEAVESYFRTYPPHTDTIKPYFSASGSPTFEYTFAVPLEPHRPSFGASDAAAMASESCGYFPEHPSGQPFIYAGRFDMLGDLNGRPTPRDEKTTGSSIGQNWARNWQLRNQFIGYVWACQQCGIDAEGVLCRGVSILKTDIKHAEAYTIYSQDLISRWHEQLRRDLWRIRRAWDEQYWDYNMADACTSYGHCVFLDACTSNTPESWLQGFEVRRWSPLEKNPAKVDDPSQERALG